MPWAPLRAAEVTNQVELERVSVAGGIEEGKARLTIEANLLGMGPRTEKPLFSTQIEQLVRVSPDRLALRFAIRIQVLQGELSEIPLQIGGTGVIRDVEGAALRDWSVRRDREGHRVLALRCLPGTVTNALLFTVTAEEELKASQNSLVPLTLLPPDPSLLSGFMVVLSDPEQGVELMDCSGVMPVESRYLPSSLCAEIQASGREPLAFRFQGAPYKLTLKPVRADPEFWTVALRDFQLTGRVVENVVSFELTAQARVKHPKGMSLELLSGGVALTEVPDHPDWRVRLEQGRFVLVFDKPGEFPVRVKFDASVRQSNGWNQVEFQVAPAALKPLILRGLGPDTQFRFVGAANPERHGSDFVSHLPPLGRVVLAWQEARAETEGKLFYAADVLEQVTISPGLMRQALFFEGRVMQGEMNQIEFRLQGEGEITRVAGDAVLSWVVEPFAESKDRRLRVRFNQPQKDSFILQAQSQTPLGALPQTLEPLRIGPEGATRYGGYLRLVNEGAVRIEVIQASGLAQISPEQFPETDQSRTLLRAGGSQRFAFRYAGKDHGVRLHADNILPEYSVSEVLSYHLGETELALDAELELEVREAPLRELAVIVPKGYALSKLTGGNVSDYSLRDLPEETEAELRLAFGSPVIGHLLLQLRFERNQSLAGEAWTLPRLEVVKARSTRGHLGVSSDAGFRLTPERTARLTEVPTAFYPRKLANIQSAFRITEPSWQATLRLERLPQTVEAVVLHLFSIGEGLLYGSSVMNFLVSGAPVSTFRVQLPEAHVEFLGKDVRSWQRIEGGYAVQLHTPVSGSYTLLAAYERPFNRQGDTLAFSGAQPLDVQGERGHIVVVSAFQYQVRPEEASAGLVALEPGEIPPEYRLFFDAPALAAYRYTSRPFTLKLALSPLAQAETLAQVVDRAVLRTRVSRQGQVVTTARYFVKSRGHPHFSLALPEATSLWSATVNGASVVPVQDAQASLIPLPQRGAADSITDIEVKLASRPPDAGLVKLISPRTTVPVLLGEWRVEPDTGRRLRYRGGSLTPAGGVRDASGFVQLATLWAGPRGGTAWGWVGVTLACLLLGRLVWQRTLRPGVDRWSARYTFGAVFGLGGMLLAVVILAAAGYIAATSCGVPGRELSFVAPVQQPGTALTLELENVSADSVGWREIMPAWPALGGLLIWIYAAAKAAHGTRHLLRLTGWLLVMWGALRMPGGLPVALLLLIVFLVLHWMMPALKHLAAVPPKAAAPTSAGGLPAVSSVLLSGLMLSSMAGRGATLPNAVFQEVVVQEDQVLAQVRLDWQASKGDVQPILFPPALLTRFEGPSNRVEIVRTTTSSKPALALRALESGRMDVRLSYHLPVVHRENGKGFVLPTHFGLVNRLRLVFPTLEVEPFSPQAISVQRESEATGTNKTAATMTLAPSEEVWIGWRPRSRDLKRESAVFFGEIHHLYAPRAGMIEGLHEVTVRPAQGELSELLFQIPGAATITDATDRGQPPAAANAGNVQTRGVSSSLVSLWRFDPETRQLRIKLVPSQSRPFTIHVRSQVSVGALPFEQTVIPPSIASSAGQVGTVGVATDSEIQLDATRADSLAVINIEDFPSSLVDALRTSPTGLTLRRAFRYSGQPGPLIIRASAVLPDVRVETRQTLSLGEDRTVLAADVMVNITRAGLFKLSFPLPPGLEVEAISGPALSHWTELKTQDDRVITLHLTGKKEGQHTFAVSLAGPGVKAATNWLVPGIVVREASKHAGQLVVVPEQGLRTQVNQREGVTQLDPQRLGIRQKGVLAFRLLQSTSRLSLDLEPVEAWVQVASLQHAVVSEGRINIAATLQYQIENTGLRSLVVRLPTNAENVALLGDQVADFSPRPMVASDSLRDWEVKLHRRAIGRYLLSATYQLRLANESTEVGLHGIEAAEVNLQRGFLALQPSGRLQLRVPEVPPSLQLSEWQSVPRSLRQNLRAETASHTFRLIEPRCYLPLQIERHAAARLLDARVNSLTLTSTISDDGDTLTQAELELIPGDKRLLQLSLPAGARFWFAFVNENAATPWREGSRILLPLDQRGRVEQAMTVTFLYSVRAGQRRSYLLDLGLLAPRLELPLENITWKVCLSEKWSLQRCDGNLQWDSERPAEPSGAATLEAYIEREAALRKEKSQAAERWLTMGNALVEEGNPRRARWAFEAAYGLSTHDDAFNEDARVQLHNVKLQQALVGLNFRQVGLTPESPLAAKLRDLRARQDVAYTQQEARQILESNNAEENAALMRLAERIIQQQEAAAAAPGAIRATLPQQGRVLFFRRSVQVDPSEELHLNLRLIPATPVPPATRMGILVALLLALGLLLWGAPRRAASR